jgi:hypothetical protein
VSSNSTTWIPYSSQNLFYEPVPYEFLYTAESAPQVLVQVNGVEAACASLNCSFNYVTPPSEITDYSLVDGTLTIIGTGFTNDIQSITLQNTNCKSIIYHDETKLTCTIVPVAGSSKPIVIAKKGRIPITSSKTIDVEIVVGQVTPSVDLNPYGGTYLTI